MVLSKRSKPLVLFNLSKLDSTKFAMCYLARLTKPSNFPGQKIQYQTALEIS